jgi:maleamate amidohydrolase
MDNKFMDSHTKEIYKNAGFTGGLTLGKSPGILVIDFQMGFTDPSQSPLAGDFGSELERTALILDKAREKDIPIFFSVIGYENEQEAGLWIRKVPSLSHLKIGSPLLEIDPRLSRRPNETVIIKKYASAFAGTHLASLLSANGIDTLLVTGTTTSGCVRGSVVDSIQHGFAPFVIEDAVCDRALGPHESNLLDMKAKYAELISTEQALAYLNHL